MTQSLYGRSKFTHPELGKMCYNKMDENKREAIFGKLLYFHKMLNFTKSYLIILCRLLHGIRCGIRPGRFEEKKEI